MFTRRVVFRLKADSSAEFRRIVEGHVPPSLRAQEGCRHEDALGDLIPSGPADDVNFWLVDTPFTTLKRGRQVNHAQLAALLRD
jgi:hypothetical protein